MADILNETDDIYAFLAGDGEMGARMRAHDWSRTPLGPIESWPQSLKTATAILLRSPVPIVMLWGKDGVMIYNDAYSVFAGARHPAILGTKVREGWPEVAAFNDHVMKVCLAGGTLDYKDQELTLVRKGAAEPAWMNLDYSPVLDESGQPAGVIAIVVETTARVLAERHRAAAIERQRRMFEQAPGFICTLVGPDHVFDFVNETYRRVFGNRAVIGKPFLEAFPDLAGQGFDDLLDEVYSSGKRRVLSNALAIFDETPDAAGEQLILDFIYEPMIDAAGKVFGIFCAGHDVTEAHRAQEALRRSEQELRQLTDALPVLVSYLDAEERYRFVNKIYEDWFPHRREDIEGRYLRDVIGEAAYAKIKPHVDQALAGGRVAFEQFMPYRDAPHRHIRGEYVPRAGADGGIEGYYALVQDISEEKRARAALHESEARYRTLFEAIEAGFCIVEVIFDRRGRAKDYRYIETNPAFERQSGLRDPVGRTIRDMVPDHEKHWFDKYGRVAKTGEPLRFEEGSAALGRWWEVHAFRVGSPGQNRVAVLFNDVSDRHRADLALRELNETLERRVAEALAERKILADIVEGTDAIIQVVDLDYRWLAINTAAADELERLYGSRPKVGDSIAEFLAGHPEQLTTVMAVWRRALAGEEFTETSEFGDADVHRGYYEMKYNVLRDAAGARIGAFHFTQNVTERVREQARLADAEEQLRQAQKMEAIGQLTGGVAHDFNNLLTPIVGSLDILERRGLGGERERRLIAGAMQSAERAKTLVQRLLAFARRQPLQRSSVDIGRLVAGMADLIASTVGPRIKVIVDIPEGLPPAEADANQLEMALLNLGVNGRDAMPDGGELRIAVSAETVGPVGAVGLQPGDYVKLSVVDTGIGMDEATLARAVEPFFSTKGTGKGTGLGLSMAHGLASQLGGALRITSQPGKGTTATFWLPVSDHAAVDPAGAAALAIEKRIGAVLLVDDEEIVRGTTAMMLAELGYEVTQAASGQEALALVEAGLEPDILVTDHLMPGMNGTELIRRFKALRPSTPALVVSGYAEVETFPADLPRITKPFRQSDLAAGIAETLARAESATGSDARRFRK